MFISLLYPFRLLYLAYLYALFRCSIITSPALVLTNLGPSYVKLGQSLSTRPDIIGTVLANDLSSLQDKLPAFAFEKAKHIIERDFGKPLEKLFSYINETAIAAASIAQVYYAKTLDGHEVAIKILRPGIEKAMARDIHFFCWTARLLERFVPSSRRMRPTSIVETLKESIKFELDLRVEASAASELKNNCAKEEFIHVPEVYWSYTSQRILTTEWITGISIYDKKNLIAAGYDLEKLSSYIAITFFNQAYRDGFFHADLHPGNLLIDSKGRLALLDFGIMGRLEKHDRLYVAQILKGFIDRDYKKVAQVHIDAGYVSADTSVALFARACRMIGEPIVGVSASEISLATLLAQLFKVTKDFSMETQPQLLLLQKTMVLVEGIGTLLNPDLNMWKLAEPWVKEWAKTHLGPEIHLKNFMDDVKESFIRMPNTLKQLQNCITTDGIKLHPDMIKSIQHPQKIIVRKCWSYFYTGTIVGAISIALLWFFV